MHSTIQEFGRYSGFTHASHNGSERLSVQLESGATINLEPAQVGDQIVISVFYPSPWKLIELGTRALRRVHYRASPARTISAGIFEDRLVLSTRVGKNQQAPAEIERAAHELYVLAQECAEQASLPAANVTGDRMP